jgi:hypothetical protein
VNGKLLAVAFVSLTTLVAMPILAQPAGPAADAPTQAAPPANPMGGPAHPGPYGMMRHKMMRRMMMMRRSPQQWCLDRLARHAARLAYIGVRLDLTAQQQPLWDKLQSAAQAAEQKTRQLCNSLKPEMNATILERMDRREQFLAVKLAAVQAAKPALQALYQALTPAQRAILDHPHHDH